MTAVQAHNARRAQALRAVLDLKGKTERERMLALIATLEIRVHEVQPVKL